MEAGNAATRQEEVILSLGEKKIWGWLWRPEPAREEGLPAVILSHGYNGSGLDFEQECRCFASNGFLALAIDFCGGSVRSKSSGSSKEMSVYTEREDLLEVLDYVRTMPEVNPERIFLFGGSQGGLVSALAAAARESQVRGLVLYYPALCIPDDWKRNFPDESAIPETQEFWGLTLGRRYFDDVRDVDPYREISGYRRETLIIHGDEDEVVALSYSIHAQEIYEKARLLILPGEKHGFSPEGTAEASETALCFMRRLL